MSSSEIHLKSGVENFIKSFMSSDRNKDVVRYGSEQVINTITNDKTKYKQNPIREERIYDIN